MYSVCEGGSGFSSLFLETLWKNGYSCPVYAERTKCPPHQIQIIAFTPRCCLGNYPADAFHSMRRVRRRISEVLHQFGAWSQGLLQSTERYWYIREESIEIEKIDAFTIPHGLYWDVAMCRCNEHIPRSPSRINYIRDVILWKFEYFIQVSKYFLTSVENKQDISQRRISIEDRSDIVFKISP